VEHPVVAIVAGLLLSGCGPSKSPPQVDRAATQVTSPQSQAAQPVEKTEKKPAISSDVAVSSTDGDWRFGYTVGKALVVEDIRPDAVVDTREAVHFWHPGQGNHSSSDYYPYVARNIGDHVDGSHGWAVRPGEFAMEASAEGQYSVAVFTPHHAGLHHVDARFEAIHFGLSTTDVHILHNGHELFSADIDGYGGDPQFHPVVGTNPAATFIRDIELAEGDTLIFAVGVGRNGTHFCDTTGLIATITSSRAGK
jgi:hypothetical protein